MLSSPLAPPSPQDVHIWQWDLEAGDGSPDGDWLILSQEERERAGKFRFERHRRRFVAARGKLRHLLGRYLGIPPAAIALGYGPEGKPFCSCQPADWRICFNLSHSEDRAALAVSNGFEIGIDIEHIRPIDEGVVQQVFSQHERTTFEALPPARRQSVFYESWARKEACLKALGTGFILSATHFEFDLEQSGDTSPRLVGGNAEEAGLWQVRALPTLSNYAGAVAARRTDWSIVEKA